MLENLLCFISNISGLELNTVYDLSSILTKAGIVPGSGYTGNEVMQKLTEALGKRPGNISHLKNFKKL